MRIRHSIVGLHLIVTSIVTALLLQGCLTAPPGEKITAERRLQDAYQKHTLVTRLVTSAHDAKLITVDQAKRYRSLALDARGVLDAAAIALDADLESAEGQIQLAEQVLIGLEEFLTKRRTTDGRRRDSTDHLNRTAATGWTGLDRSSQASRVRRTHRSYSGRVVRYG